MTGETVKVAWVSRHSPLPVQIETLKQKLGEIEIVQISKTFTDYREILNAVKSTGAKYAVVVLPLSLIAQIVQDKSITWLFARMQGLHECLGPEKCPEFDPTRDVWLPLHGSDKGRHMRFERFEKIVKVEMVTEPF